MGGWWRTLRWRLTLFYTALILGLLILLGLFVYVALDHFLTANAADQLSAQARLFPTPPKPKDKGAPNSADPLQRSRDYATQIASPTLYAAILNGQGQISTTPRTPTFVPPLPVALPAYEQTDIVTLRVGNTNMRGVRLVTPLRNNDGMILGYVVLATDLHDTDVLLAQLQLLLILGVVGVGVLAVGFGLILARVSLRPLSRVTLTARSIANGVGTDEADLGRRVYVPGRGVPADDEVGQLVNAFNTMLDQIETAFAARRESEARTRRFVADASHELRSPLTTLGGSLDVLLRGVGRDDPATLMRVLRRMRTETDRMSHLAIDLLTLARFDAADPQYLITSTPLQLDSLLNEIVTERQQGQSRSITFRPKNAQAVWIEGDAERLRQVMTNLLDNAIRHTAPDGHISVDLHTDATHATVGVADDGEGIAPEHVPHLFERFYRVDAARSRTTGSVGLGLAIVKALIEAHHGTICVESVVGTGTTVIFRLPCVPLAA